MLDSAFINILREPLDSVQYWILSSDVESLDPFDPNRTGGCQAIHLLCGPSTVCITWQSRKADAISDAAFQITLHDLNMPAPWYANLVAVDAAAQSPWKECIGLPITGITLMGWNCAPQVLQVVCGTIKVFICVGYSGEPPMPGDGDELLIYSGMEWLQLGNTFQGLTAIEG